MLGEKFSTVELDNLAGCVNAGANLFITGQDILEKNDTAAFFKNYLGVGFGANTNIVYSKGIARDLFEGFGFYTTFTNNQTSRDTLTFSNPRAKRILAYGGLGNLGIAAVRIDSGGAGSKIIVIGFGFEAISNEVNHQRVVQKVIEYFDGTIILGSEEELLRNIPASFRLEQNYPNPFHPVTQIRFEVSVSGFVSLRVFDVLGRIVATLVSEDFHPGSYNVSWDGSGYPSGIYYYKLTTPRFSDLKKMVLIK